MSKRRRKQAKKKAAAQRRRKAATRRKAARAQQQPADRSQRSVDPWDEEPADWNDEFFPELDDRLLYEQLNDELSRQGLPPQQMLEMLGRLMPDELAVGPLGPASGSRPVDPRVINAVNSARGRCLPPIHVDGQGQVVPDPYEVLPLDRDERSEEVIRRAWQQALLAHPPERDAEGAARVQAARDRLLDPRRVIERELGMLYVPNPASWGFAELQLQEPGPEPRHLVGQFLLYALLEDMLINGQQNTQPIQESGAAHPKQNRAMPSSSVGATVKPSGTSTKGSTGKRRRREPRQGSLFED